MKKQEKAIKEIIKKYGDNINLKASPFLIAEIIRNYAHNFIPTGIPGKGLAEEPPPGTPPVPGGLPPIDGRVILTEILKISNSLKLLNKKIDKLK